MRQLFVIIAPTCYRILDSSTHTLIAHLVHLWRIWGHVCVESMCILLGGTCIMRRGIVHWGKMMLSSPSPSHVRISVLVHHGHPLRMWRTMVRVPEWHECNVTPLRNEVKVSPTFCLAQSAIDADPVICLNVCVSSPSILLGRGMPLSMSSSSSNNLALERPIHNIRQVRDKYVMNVGTYWANLEGMSYHSPSILLSDLSRHRVFISFVRPGLTQMDSEVVGGSCQPIHKICTTGTHIYIKVSK
jgi:hypothetical protein